MRYPNGMIPDAALETLCIGYNAEEGEWKHQLPRSTRRKWERLRQRAYKRTSRWLEITDGWGGYRPIAAQRYAKDRYGDGAADVGKSSHGGWWEGQDTMAIDVGNWSWVYDGDRTAFYADARAEGLTPGLITPARGYAVDEPWHLVDLDPWAPTPDDTTPAAPREEDEDDDMSINTMYYTKDPGWKYRIAICNDTSGLWIEYVTNSPTINNTLAEKYKTGSAIEIGEAFFKSLRTAHAAVRPQSNLQVDVAEADG